MHQAGARASRTLWARGIEMPGLHTGTRWGHSVCLPMEAAQWPLLPLEHPTSWSRRHKRWEAETLGQGECGMRRTQPAPHEGETGGVGLAELGGSTDATGPRHSCPARGKAMLTSRIFYENRADRLRLALRPFSLVQNLHK